MELELDDDVLTAAAVATKESLGSRENVELQHGCKRPESDVVLFGRSRLSVRV